MRFHKTRGEKIHLPKHYLATMCIQNKFHLEHLKIEKKATKINKTYTKYQISMYDERFCLKTRPVSFSRTSDIDTVNEI